MNNTPWLPWWLVIAGFLALYVSSALERQGRDKEAYMLDWVALALFLFGMAATP